MNEGDSMLFSIKEPAYVTTLSLCIEGSIDEGKPGYHEPNDDPELGWVKEELLKCLKDNQWTGMKVLFYDIVSIEIAGYGSSGYPNHLEVIFGITNMDDLNKLKSLLRKFCMDRFISPF